MTVAQLIKHLEKMPQNKVVTINNNDLYVNGDYEVSKVTNWSTVEICTDYKKRIGADE